MGSNGPGRPVARRRGERRAARALLAFLLLAAGCRSPIGVERVSPERVQREQTRTVLSEGRLSEYSRNILRRTGLLEVFEQDPVLALEAAHERLLTRADRATAERIQTRSLVAMAEASFLYASRSGDRRYFVQSAIYAWAFLFGTDAPLEPLDPLVQLATDLYNRGLTRALLRDDPDAGVEIRSAEIELPIGTLEIEVDPEELRLGERRFVQFMPVEDLRIRGLDNRYRVYGLGAALSATTEASAGAGEASRILSDRVRVPVSLVLVIDDVMPGIESGRIRSHVKLLSLVGSPTIELGERRYPAAFETSASLALMLSEIAPWRNELRRLFEGDLEREGDGLSSLSLHRTGRMPVVFVHGTASSTATWSNMVNDLLSDPLIRDHYEFWLFTYNTGAPILYSASLLRQGLAEMVATIDPEGLDPALRQAVVIGHSQGGLVTKLQVVDSGDAFWRRIAEVPLDQLEMKPETRELIQQAVFVEPSPYVGRVVFIATPHRGSYLLTYGPSNLLLRFVQAPSDVLRATSDLVTQNTQAAAVRRIDDVEGALNEMNPASPFLATLLPMALATPGHSIIAERKLTDKADATDGVVTYESAHLDGVESEVVVESGHSCLANPQVVEEVRRILLMHLLLQAEGP